MSTSSLSKAAPADVRKSPPAAGASVVSQPSQAVVITSSGKTALAAATPDMSLSSALAPINGVGAALQKFDQPAVRIVAEAILAAACASTSTRAHQAHQGRGGTTFGDPRAHPGRRRRGPAPRAGLPRTWWAWTTSSFARKS